MDTPLLDKVNGPSDLRGFSISHLHRLAEEIRAFLIESVSGTGGHLAPNLGVVELTIALHSVFSCPHDKLIWDVGHQSYVHKILTGRKEEFSTLRQYAGLSGFPKRAESKCDPFDTGHSSTSISAALGMALARDLNGEDYNIIAVIGDGAMTGGMAFEALNHAGHMGKNMIVVLNDNEMSISENVGALAGYLSRMRTDPKYYKHKEEMELMLKKIPSIGPTVVKAIERIKDSFKYLVVPGMIFEELGFTYLGPINGHDIALMKTVLERAKKSHGPIIVHVVTRKGKGYKPAEDNPDKFHGIGPFDIDSGNGKGTKKASYTDVFGSTLCEIAEQNEKVVAISAAMPSGTGLTKFQDRFPKRFFDVGIAEQHAVTMAAGLSVNGYIPVVAIYSTFLQRAYDQILHDVSLQGLHVIFAIDRAGLVGEDGETHQGVFDVSYLRHIPGMTVMAPKDENELRLMLKAAVEAKGPVAVRYPRGAGMGVPLTDIDCPDNKLPRGADLLREGSDITIAAIGPLVYTALEAAESLHEEGICAAVINARYIKPLDEECLIENILKTGSLLTVEENVLQGGFGSAVLEMLNRKGINIQVKCMGIADEFVSHGTPDILRQKYGLTSQGIISHVREMLSGEDEPKKLRKTARIKVLTKP
ncbi:MAG: 1-deoxy-D-xylulose-5-phosphate synthase [Firmicutes bacterium HGW-Firmicutes-14]|nr:MAG: 1-deoxy-D-xylulose-5-phosphate synthase [Firmicutes bacterium HGW-Firmicutes-14]